MAQTLRRAHAQRARTGRVASFSKEIWAVRWDTNADCLDGITSRFVFDRSFHPLRLAVFETRQKAREFIERQYGYLKTRPDLRAAPHGWLYPIPVKVRLTAAEIEAA
jgi:hypothetical protein